MSYRKHGLRALGLSFAAVLGAMALMAAGASATAFLYLEGGVTKTLAAGLESQPTISAHTDITIRVPAKNLKILCQRAEADAANPLKFLGGTSGVGHGHLVFKECKSFQESTGAEQKNCVPKSPGALAGEILAGGLAKLILHPANNTMMLFEPLSGKEFSRIEFGELCALFETANLTGSFVAECGELGFFGGYSGGNCATHRVEQLLKPLSSVELSVVLKDLLNYGASAAFLEGIIAVKFGPPCTGCAWGADGP
jgi:hypothetical protein